MSTRCFGYLSNFYHFSIDFYWFLCWILLISGESVRDFFRRRPLNFSNIWTGRSKYFGGPNITWQDTAGPHWIVRNREVSFIEWLRVTSSTIETNAKLYVNSLPHGEQDSCTNLCHTRDGPTKHNLETRPLPSAAISSFRINTRYHKRCGWERSGFETIQSERLMFEFAMRKWSAIAVALYWVHMAMWRSFPVVCHVYMLESLACTRVLLECREALKRWRLNRNGFSIEEQYFSTPLRK